uniref:Uncharacterized protein n=1 Tax=Oryza glumipatula TaxID=40148 RepID=A0A0D9ZP14_9ORYZ
MHSCRVWPGVRAVASSSGFSGPAAKSFSSLNIGCAAISSMNSASSARDVFMSMPELAAFSSSCSARLMSSTNSFVMQASTGWNWRPCSRTSRCSGSNHPMLYDMATHCSPNASPFGRRAAWAAAKEFNRSYTTTTPGRQPLEQRGERDARRDGEALQHEHQVGREGRGGRVGGRGLVGGDVEVVEADGAERVGVPPVQAQPRLPEVRRRRRVVHVQPPRREQQRQVALRREGHRDNGHGFHRANRH